jgi:putative transposase
MLAWFQRSRIAWHFNAPGKPMQNGICEAFKRPHARRIYDVDHARSTVSTWTARYNQSRPHSALGYLTPAAFAEHLTATGDRLRNPDSAGLRPESAPASLSLACGPYVRAVKGPPRGRAVASSCGSR